MATEPVQPDRPADGHPEWFRPPTRREHAIAGGVFFAFGLFFIALFLFQAGWWFRWVLLVLGTISAGRGLRHTVTAMRMPAGPSNDGAIAPVARPFDKRSE